MNSKWSEVGRMINHYRYLIVVVVGVLIVGFVDDNSFIRRLQYELQISDLKKQHRHRAASPIEARPQGHREDSARTLLYESRR